ncbi:MAG: group III truncated hemoglobin [Saprospiraceae bacterium]
MSLPDIQNRNDLLMLVSTFYQDVRKDEILKDKFMQVVWETHIPVMVDFWDNVIFYNGNYNGNPMLKHLLVNSITPLTEAHFSRWLSLNDNVVDRLFSGPNATMLKEKAHNIAHFLQNKVIKKSGE